jgi:hypothetical protein
MVLLLRGSLLSCLLAASALSVAAAEWRSLFNGKDLTGWKVVNGTAPFTVEDGILAGTTMAGSPNSFLATEETFGDFVLELEVMHQHGPSNSGVQFRSAQREDGRVHGYQCEFDPSPRGWTGGIYDEARRGWLYPGDLNPGAKTAYQPARWNQIRIEAIGPSLRTWVNGQPVAHVIDDLTPRGFIALQVHSVADADAGRRVLWRNIRIQTADLSPAPVDAIPIRNVRPNDLHAAEREQGWRLLWDGQTTRGWRGANRTNFPERGWIIEDGTLKVLATPEGQSRPGGDIVTQDEFSAFELQLEFRLTPGANSGIKYFVQENAPGSGGAALGLEYQLLDDERHPDAKQGVDGNRTLASLYDLIGRRKMPGGLAIAPRIGEWQHARLVARANGQVEHWLNGIKAVEYDRGSADFQGRIARSKYADFPGFGLSPRGRLLLQGHGSEVHFRSIKLRALE